MICAAKNDECSTPFKCVEEGCVFKRTESETGHICGGEQRAWSQAECTLCGDGRIQSAEQATSAEDRYKRFEIKYAPCACYPEGNPGDCPAPGCRSPTRGCDKCGHEDDGHYSTCPTATPAQSAEQVTLQPAVLAEIERNQHPRGYAMNAETYRQNLSAMAEFAVQQDRLARSSARRIDPRYAGDDPAASYAKQNPLGGPASVFRAMAARIEAGEEYYDVLDDYGFKVKEVESATATTEEAKREAYHRDVGAPVPDAERSSAQSATRHTGWEPFDDYMPPEGCTLIKADKLALPIVLQAADGSWWIRDPLPNPTDSRRDPK